MVQMENTFLKSVRISFMGWPEGSTHLQVLKDLFSYVVSKYNIYKSPYKCFQVDLLNDFKMVYIIHNQLYECLQ